MALLGKSNPGGGNSKGKGPEAQKNKEGSGLKRMHGCPRADI